MELVKNAPLGARASRPHKAWHNRGYLRHFDGREPRKGGFGALYKGVAVAGRLFAGRRCGRDARAPRGAMTGCSETNRAGLAELVARVGAESVS